jgi:hypothetical protein
MECMQVVVWPFDRRRWIIAEQDGMVVHPIDRSIDRSSAALFINNQCDVCVALLTLLAQPQKPSVPGDGAETAEGERVAEGWLLLDAVHARGFACWWL